jgi:CRISPR-associated protein (TIGR03984 family)
VATRRRACVPALRVETLREARLFGETGELLLWRNGDNLWQARLIEDVKNGDEATWEEALDESEMLWGNRCRPLLHDFTLLYDAGQGLRHAIPIPPPGTCDDAPPVQVRLQVRHYLAKGEDIPRVVASRLVKLVWEESQS